MSESTPETSDVEKTETHTTIVGAKHASVNESESESDNGSESEKKNKQNVSAKDEIGAINSKQNKIENVTETENKIETETESKTEVDLKSEQSADPVAKSGTATKVEHDEIAQYAEHVTYTEDGEAIYTDPSTQYKYKWNTKQNNWQPLDTTGGVAAENEHFKWCEKTQQWLPKQTETEHYKWDAEKRQWLLKSDVNKAEQNTDEGGGGGGSVGGDDVTYGIDEEGQRIYTDKDGAVYFWDTARNAWFPKIDDDFMARYQMNYGFIDNTSASEAEKQEQQEREKEEAKRSEEEFKRMVEEARAGMENPATSATTLGNKRKAQEPPKWFDLDPSQNTKVYVWNLPLDITMDEFAELMGKCGMIMRDPNTQKYKLKLYTEADGQIKGDGLCDYIKIESVDLALKILDEYNLRGHKIRVQRAKFQMRGEYNPALKPKKKKKDKEKLQKMKEKLFDWRPDKMRGERSKNEKVVIIKNLFSPDLFEKEVQLILDYQNDLREECTKCGIVRKVVIYDRHPEGVAQINMSSPEEADLVIQMMHGRFFGKRQLTAEHWDGKTKYKIDETATEAQERLSNWDQFLEDDETATEAATDKTKAATAATAAAINE